MAHIDYKKAHFLISAAQLSQLPGDFGKEVAFVGRSNAGKSSALNTLTHQKGLAKTSKTPGRTQLINLFSLDETRRLVDLPGYGYAKVPEAVKARWQATLAQYLETRECLKGLVLLVDSRHSLKDADEQMLQFCQQRQLPCHIVLTKSDKLSRQEQVNVLREVESAIKNHTDFFSVQLFSATHKTGLDLLTRKTDGWFA